MSMNHLGSDTRLVAERPRVVDHYGAHYRDFAADVYAEVRRAAFGEDVGQNSWITVDELDRLVSRLELGPETRLLDVACGSGDFEDGCFDAIPLHRRDQPSP
jgi:hypothetical protein